MLQLQLPRASSQARQDTDATARTFKDGRIQGKAFALSTEAPDRLATARTFIHALVAAWWRALTAADRRPVPLREPFQPLALSSLPDPAGALAVRLGEEAAGLETNVAAYQIGLAYGGMLPPEHRAAMGIYYTPPALTARLIAQATEAGVDWTRCRVLDPACGGGAFLAPVAQRILEQLPGCNARVLLENIATRLEGYELDPFGAWLSQVSLDAVLLPVCRDARRNSPVVVRVCDSLRRRLPQQRFDLVIGNPPYGRVRLDPAQRRRFKRSLYGHANVYGLFTDLALRFVKPQGVIALVTPTSFLAGEYFKNLRLLLGRSAPPAVIDFVDMRKGVFDDVLQETLLATYREGASPGEVAICEIAPTVRGDLIAEKAGSFTLPADPSQPWLLPRNRGQARLVAVLTLMKHRLADWGYGVSTGPLVWNRHKDQLASEPGPKRYPLVWAEAVTSDGRFVWRAEKKNHAPYFEVRAGDDWLMIRRPCVLVQRTTAKEQHRRLIAAALPASLLGRHGSVVIENHLNMVRPTTDPPLVPPGVLAAFLNSAAADRAFRCVSGSVAVSAYELESLPLPDPEALHELAHLLRGKARRSQLEAACARLYSDDA
jgi:adenine-specific DNA-methyltransferase